MLRIHTLRTHYSFGLSFARPASTGVMSSIGRPRLAMLLFLEVRLACRTLMLFRTKLSPLTVAAAIIFSISWSSAVMGDMGLLPLLILSGISLSVVSGKVSLVGVYKRGGKVIRDDKGQ